MEKMRKNLHTNTLDLSEIINFANEKTLEIQNYQKQKLSIKKVSIQKKQAFTDFLDYGVNGSRLFLNASSGHSKMSPFFKEAFLKEQYAIELINYIKTHDNINSFFMFNTSVTKKTVQFVSDLFKITTLTSIDLDSNNIGDDGAKDIAEALKTNSTLTSIDLQSNNIGDDGAKDIAEALQINSSITSIKLKYNNISDKMIKTIDSLIENNRFLNKTSDAIVEDIFNLSPDILSIEKLDPKVQKLVQIKLAKMLDQKINNLSKEFLIELNESIYERYNESEIFDNTCAIMYEETKEICNLGLYQHFLKLKFVNLGKEFLKKMDKIFSDSRDSCLKQDLVELLQHLNPQENPIAKQGDIFEANEFERSKSFMELLRNRPMKVIIEELTNLDLENLSASQTKDWKFTVNIINKIKVNLNKESAWTKDILNIPIFYNEIELPDNSGIVEDIKIERNHISYDESQRLEWEKEKQIEADEKNLYIHDNLDNRFGNPNVVKTSGYQDGKEEVDN